MSATGRSERPKSARSRDLGTPMSVLREQWTEPPEVKTTFRSDYPMPTLLGDKSYDAARAPIWREFIREATSFDSRMIKGWNETLDVMLIFAALFSAVVTAFLVAVMVSPTPGTTSSVASSVTSIWYLSLSGSLLISIAIMHVKYWLRSYLESEMSTPRERARLRQYRYEGLQKWRLPFVIDSMPLWLQGTVFLFLVGLVLFLWSAENVLGGIVIATIAVAFAGYTVTTTLPAIYADCPFVSPLSSVISYAAGVGEKVVDVSAHSVQHSLEEVLVHTPHIPPLVHAPSIPVLVHAPNTPVTAHTPNTPGDNQYAAPAAVTDDYFTHAGSGIPSHDTRIQNKGPELMPFPSPASQISSNGGSDAATLVEPRIGLSTPQARVRTSPSQRTRSVYFSPDVEAPRRPPLIRRPGDSLITPQESSLVRRTTKPLRRHSSGIFIPHSQRTRQVESIKDNTVHFDALALVWLVTYSPKEDVQEDALLAFISWQMPGPRTAISKEVRETTSTASNPPDPPTAKWDEVHETISTASHHAFYHRMLSVSSECPSTLKARLIAQLPRLAGLCNVAFGEEKYPGRRILPKCIPALFEIASGKDLPHAKKSRPDLQSLQLLACVVLLHLKHHWSSDYDRFPSALPHLVQRCARLFESQKELPLYASCMFLNYMAIRQMADLDAESRRVLCHFVHDMTSEEHARDDPVPFQLRVVLAHVQRGLPADTPAIFAVNAEPAKDIDAPAVRFLPLTPP